MIRTATACASIGALCAAFSLVSLPARPSVAACPEDSLWCGCGAGMRVLSTEPGFACPAGAWQAGSPCDGACYDLRAGRLAVALPGSAGCHSMVDAEDDYWVTGIPAGSPTLFTAELRVVGQLSGDTEAAVLVREGSLTGSAAFYDASDSPVDHTVVALLMHAAGEVFRLTLRLAALNTLAPAGAEMTASLSFGGLPPGAVVHSCQGYEATVPALPGTWGRVKALYR